MGLLLLGSGLTLLTICAIPDCSKARKLALLASLQRQACIVSYQVRNLGAGPTEHVDAQITTLRHGMQELASHLTLKDKVLSSYKAQLDRLDRRMHWLDKMLEYHAARAQYAKAQRLSSEIRAEAAQMVVAREKARADYARLAAEEAVQESDGGVAGAGIAGPLSEQQAVQEVLNHRGLQRFPDCKKPGPAPRESAI